MFATLLLWLFAVVDVNVPVRYSVYVNWLASSEAGNPATFVADARLMAVLVLWTMYYPILALPDRV